MVKCVKVKASSVLSAAESTIKLAEIFHKTLKTFKRAQISVGLAHEGWTLCIWVVQLSEINVCQHNNEKYKYVIIKNK